MDSFTRNFTDIRVFEIFFRTTEVKIQKKSLKEEIKLQKNVGQDSLLQN